MSVTLAIASGNRSNFVYTSQDVTTQNFFKPKKHYIPEKQMI
jgi:hypothetical protein